MNHRYLMPFAGAPSLRWLRLLVVGLLGWLWGGALAACPPEPELPGRGLMAQAQQQAQDRGFLWRVSRGGRDSFVYGSLHAGRREWFALGPQTEAALARTGVLALEMNATDPAELATWNAALQTAPRTLPAPVQADLAEAWQVECLPLADLDRGPAELHVMRLGAAQAQRRGLFALYSVESLLLMRSLRTERPVMGLEAVRTQLSALLARNDADAAALVASALQEWKAPLAVASIDRLTEVWARGDLDALERYAQWCGCLETEPEREAFARLVDARNPAMADTLERTHAHVSVFAAVGALHVAGPQGLPALLRARGFTVTRVF